MKQVSFVSRAMTAISQVFKKKTQPPNQDSSTTTTSQIDCKQSETKVIDFSNISDVKDNHISVSIGEVNYGTSIKNNMCKSTSNSDDDNDKHTTARIICVLAIIMAVIALAVIDTLAPELNLRELLSEVHDILKIVFS